MIPMNVKIVIQEQDHKPFRLWLPLWLILPFIILFGILILPFLTLIVLIVIVLKGLSFFISACGAIMGMFMAFKGTKIEVSGKNNIYIEID